MPFCPPPRPAKLSLCHGRYNGSHASAGDRHPPFGVCDPEGTSLPAPRHREYTLPRHALLSPRLLSRRTPIHHHQHLSPHAPFPLRSLSALLCPEGPRTWDRRSALRTRGVRQELHFLLIGWVLMKQPRDARPGEFSRRLAVVKLEVLLFARCVHSSHGSDALSSTDEVPLGSQTLNGECLRQPACSQQLRQTSPVATSRQMLQPLMLY